MLNVPKLPISEEAEITLRFSNSGSDGNKCTLPPIDEDPLMAQEPPRTINMRSQKETGVNDKSFNPSVGEEMFSPFQKTAVCRASVPRDERVEDPPAP